MDRGRWSLLGLTGLTLLGASVACGGPPYRAKEKSPKDAATVDKTVLVVLDDDVKWAIELLDHRQVVLPDGRLRAELRLANRSAKDLHVQVAWTFKDDSNFPVEGDTPFEHVLLSGGQTTAIAKESRATTATAFHVQVKTARSAQD
jgi:hypothetical protein